MNDIYYTVAHRSQTDIDSFKNRYESFDENLIPQIFKKSLNLTATSWKPSKSAGSSHIVYFVDTKEKGILVLRTNTGLNPEPEYVMEVEKLITQKASAVGVPINKVIYADISRNNFPFDFQIQEVLEGKDPEIYFKGSKEKYDQISFDLGAKVAKYHQIKLPSFGRFDPKEARRGELIGTKATHYDYVITCLDDDLKYLIDVDVISTEKAKTIRQLFDKYKSIINIPQGALIHHDLADHNITFQDNKVVGIFDWEAAVIADPVLDLASCPTWKTIYPRTEKLLEGYQTISELPENFQEKWDIYTLRTILWKTVYCIRMDILNDARAARFLDSLKPFKI